MYPVMNRDSLGPESRDFVSITTMCSFCPKTGRLRCSVCKSWYCTQFCQINHWPTHKRECVPVPHLEWPDGSKYNGSLENGNTVEIENQNHCRPVVRDGVLLEPVAMAIGIESGGISHDSESKGAVSDEGESKLKSIKAEDGISITTTGIDIPKPTAGLVKESSNSTSSSSLVNTASQSELIKPASASKDHSLRYHYLP